MDNIKEDAKAVNEVLKKILIAQIQNCKIEDPKEIEKACKAYIILAVKISEETTERYLSSIEYFGQNTLAAKAISVDYYNDTEVRISTPLKAGVVLIEEFAENRTFGDEQRYLSGLFKSAPEYLKIAAHTFLVQYAYYKTKRMCDVTYLMSKFKILED